MPRPPSSASVASGSTAPARQMRLFATTTAPSCSGDVDVKIASMRSAERRASTTLPADMCSATESRRGMTTSAPLPRAASVNAARAMTAATFPAARGS
jgi:hypothetical protein